MSLNPWIFAGYDSPIEGYCSRPQRVVNLQTGEWHLKRCGSGRPSRCEPCAETHKRDVAGVGRSGWADNPRDRAIFLTLTPPGADRLPWDRSKCRHSPGLRCSGKHFGCQIEENAAARWHDDIGKRWSRVIEDVRRELNPGETATAVSRRSVRFEYMRTWELQIRGALHAHSMGRLEGVCTQERFEAVLREAARRHGFGDQVDVQVIDMSDPVQAARKAGYIAKYASKCADELASIRRLNSATGEIRSGGVRSWSASRNWGDTMKQMRLRRCQWAAIHGGTARKRSGTGTACTGGLDSYQDHSASGVIQATECRSDQSSALV